MNIKRNFIECSLESLTDGQYVNCNIFSTDSLKSIIDKLYNISNKSLSKELFTRTLFIKFYQENRIGSFGLELKIDQPNETEENVKKLILDKFNNSAFDCLVMFTKLHDGVYGYVYSLDCKLSDLESILSELNIELETKNSKFITNELVEIRKNTNLERLYEYLILCRRARTIIPSVYSYLNINLDNLGDYILYVENQMSTYLNITELKIETNRMLTSNDLFNRYNLIDYENPEDVRTVGFYSMYGKEYIEYIPEYNSLYSKKLSKKLIKGEIIVKDKLPFTKRSLTKYLAVENNWVEVLSTEKAVPPNTEVEIFEDYNIVYYNRPLVDNLTVSQLVV